MATNDLPYLNGAPASTSPLTNGSDTMSLPILSPTQGQTEMDASSAQHSGDMGGA